MTDGFFDEATTKLVSSDSPPELLRDDIWGDAGYTFHLVGRYLRAEPVAGSLLIALLAALAIYGSYFGLQLQLHSAHLTDALIARHIHAVWIQLFWISMTFLQWIISGMAITLVNLTIRIRWRTVFTNNLIARWLHANRFYFMEREGAVDHPEQRIQEDLFLLPELLVQLGPGAIGSFANVILYGGTLWVQSGTMNIHAGGVHFAIPGYMMFAALVSAVFWTVMMHLVGRPITRVQVVTQRLEATFRHDLAKIRESAESIALESGVDVETSRINAVFAMIRTNWRHYTFYQTRMSGVSVLQHSVLLILPTLLCIPQVVAGKMSVGNMGLVAGSFLAVYDGFGFLAGTYLTIAQLRSAVVRIRFFEGALAKPNTSGIIMREEVQPDISADDLVVAFPDGRVMIDVGALTLSQGDRLIIRGRSGSGKSTLLRAIGGLWPHGSGAISHPKARKIMFLPQRSYMPDGTLAALLSYPLLPGDADDTYVKLLAMFGLSAHRPRLHEHATWRHILSPGEQQRVAAARAVLRQPDFLFLDEATSALDSELVTALYENLLRALPQAAIISVAHQPAIEKFHHELLQISNFMAVRSPLSVAGRQPVAHAETTWI